MEYCILMLSFIVICQIIMKKLYKTSLIVFLVGVINTFIAPVIYYSFMNGASYNSFSNDDYSLYLYICIVVLVVIILCNYFFSNKLINLNYTNIKVDKIGMLYTAVVIVVAMIYILAYYNYFPLLSFIDGNEVIDSLNRPDMTGALPMYFTMQTFMIGVLPMMYFYYYEYFKHNRFLAIFCGSSVIFFLIVGGNKGILVYFLLFLWIFVWNNKLNIKILMSVIGCFCFYNIMMNNSINDIDSLGSPLRRFFITQGAMFINRMNLVETFISEDADVSKRVFEIVYGYSGGTAPTFFIGDILIEYGLIIGMILSIGIVVFIYLVVKILNGKKRYIDWYLFFVMYLLIMSGINISFFIRLCIMSISLFIFMIYKLDIEK